MESQLLYVFLWLDLFYFLPISMVGSAKVERFLAVLGAKTVRVWGRGADGRGLILKFGLGLGLM